MSRSLENGDLNPGGPDAYVRIPRGEAMIWLVFDMEALYAAAETGADAFHYIDA
jgi:hypothetical protein